MKNIKTIILVWLVMSALLTACGPSPEEQAATATQGAANIFATLTAEAPTATMTFTPSPTATPTPTITPTPTTTPTVTPTPTPQWMTTVLSLEDLPDGFRAMTTTEIDNFYLPAKTNSFGFIDEANIQIVLGFLRPLETRIDQRTFDEGMPDLIAIFSGVAAQSSQPKALTGLDDIGEMRSGSSFVTTTAGLSFYYEVMLFRRGKVGVALFAICLEGDQLAVAAGDLARLIDGRLSPAAEASMGCPKPGAIVAQRQDWVPARYSPQLPGQHANLASTSTPVGWDPFVGDWYAKDPVDGSEETLSIAQDSDWYCVVIRDDKARLCGVDKAGNPEFSLVIKSAGVARGKMLVTASISVTCLSNPQESIKDVFRMNFTYQPTTDTLKDDVDFTTWLRQ